MRTTEDLRLDALIEDAHRTLDTAIASVESDGRFVAAVVCLFSGGNDSTTLAYLMRERVTHYGMANTQIGIEATRQYVRDTVASWGKPLVEKTPPPGKGYRDLVLGRVKPGPRGKLPLVWPGGFPGPAGHGLFFQRLKERCFDQIRNELVGNPRQNRLVFLAGRRAEESARRTRRLRSGELTDIERRGSVVWASPLLNWTKLDLNAYRRRFPDVPRNEVSDLLHMSGECLCGCFGHADELEEIRMWFPDTAEYIDNLQEEVRAAGLSGVKPEHCQWNWKGDGRCKSGLCNV